MLLVSLTVVNKVCHLSGFNSNLLMSMPRTFHIRVSTGSKN